MPLFVYVPAKPASKVRPHHVQKDQKKKPAIQSEARTLLPMSGMATSGGTSSAATSTSTSPGVTSLPVDGGTGSTGNAGRLDPLGQPGGQPGGQSNGNQGSVIQLLPTDGKGDGKGKTPVTTVSVAGKKTHPFELVGEVYFDAGAEDLIGSFTTLVARAGVRYEKRHEIHVYFRNETLDTRGTNLPFTSVIAGSSVGVDYRYWCVPNHFFITISDGRYISGPNQDKDDPRIGLVGEWSWRYGPAFTDIYTDLFYIDLVKDSFYTGRLRHGLVLSSTKHGDIPDTQLMGYVVGQLFASGKGTVGTTDRVEGGMGVAYEFIQDRVSLNIELRGGYAYRGEINRRTYLNPMIVLSGSFNTSR